jgi:sodium transport system permease protein
VAIVAAALATYLIIPSLVPRELWWIAAQAALVVVPVFAVVAARLTRPLSALGLRGARPRFFLAAIAIGATAWYVNAWIDSLLPLPEQQTRELEDLVHRPSLGTALVMFALVPALCEEILFRGVLARALGRRGSIVAAAAISGAVFAAYHLSLVQALPTMTLGFVLAVIAIRADSVLPTMVAHAVNNALAIALSRDELPAVGDWFGHHPVLALAGCIAATASGIVIALRGPS